MEKIPPQAGWLWVKEGFALFRKQPAALSTLFLSYLLLMFAIGVVPLLGQGLPFLLAPAFAMAFMQACVNIEQGKRVHPSLLFVAFRSPAFISLLKLGVLYLAAALLSAAASIWVDDGLFWRFITGQIELDEKTIVSSDMPQAMLFFSAVYVVIKMIFWYSAPLIAWQNMPVGKAVFYSFFTMPRSAKALVIYALAWLVIGVLLPVFISTFAAVLLNQAVATFVVLLPLTIVMAITMYCSTYPTYTHIFGKPEADPAARTETDSPQP